jgi:hypothetical protein
MMAPKIVKLAALMKDGLMIVVVICMRKGLRRPGFLELHNRPDHPITSPRHPRATLGIIHHVRHFMACPVCSNIDIANKTMNVMHTPSVGT